jgi:hypothetical protein
LASTLRTKTRWRKLLNLDFERRLQEICVSLHAVCHSHRLLQSGCPPREVRSFCVLLMWYTRGGSCSLHRSMKRPRGCSRGGTGQRFQVRLLSHVLRLELAVYPYLLGFEFASDAEGCMDVSRRGRRTCISAPVRLHNATLKVLVFLTRANGCIGIAFRWS